MIINYFYVYLTTVLISLLLCIWASRRFESGMNLNIFIKTILMCLMWPVSLLAGIIWILADGAGTNIQVFDSYKTIKENKQKAEGYDN